LTPCNKISRSLTGYTMARVYRTLYRLPISINLLQFSCGYTCQKLLHYCAYLARMTRSNSKNEAKALLRGHCPLCATRCFIGALVLWHLRTTCGPGPSKPTAFLVLCSPSQEAAMTKPIRASPLSFQINSRATLPIKPLNTKLSNNGVPPIECI